MSKNDDYNYLIETRNLTKYFGKKSNLLCALDNINLIVKAGEFVAIQGPSGCGKSTLLSILGLLDVSTGGEYLLCGHHVEKLTKYQHAILRNKHIGWIFQSFNLIGDMTVQENISLPLRYNDSIPKSDHMKLIGNAIEKVGLSDKATAYPGQLSGGQQQRVAIARAIVATPDIIIADEPTGNLDTKNTEVIFDLLKDLNVSGTTILMVTHDPELANKCKRVINMKDGRIDFYGMMESKPSE